MKLSFNDVVGLVKALSPEQRQRVVHVNRQKFDIYIGRQYQRRFRQSDWANDFRLDDDTLYGHLETEVEKRQLCLMHYTKDLLTQHRDLLVRLPELEGKTLGCWCRKEHDSDVLCHGLVLVALTDYYAAWREDQAALRATSALEEAEGMRAEALAHEAADAEAAAIHELQQATLVLPEPQAKPKRKRASRAKTEAVGAAA